MAPSSRDPPGTTLDHLPNELLDRIFGNFATTRTPDGQQVAKGYVYDAWHTNRQVLRNLVLVSKRFRRIAENQLYRVFCYDGRRKQLRRFVQTLSTRPKLARNIKIVYLETWGDDPGDIPFEDDSWQEIAAKAGFAGEEQSRFLADMSKGNLFADIILLLTAATNLTVLGMEIPYHPMPWLRPFLQRQAHIQRSEGPLCRLRHAELWHWDTEGGFSPNACADLLHLPSLQHVTGFMCAGGPEFDSDGDVGEDEEDNPTVWPEVRTSNVTSISLVESLVTADGVGQLLSRSKAIKSFEYRLGSAVVGWHDLSFSDLWPHLHSLGQSLEALTLDSQEYDLWNMANDDEQPPRLILSHFPCLKRLAISQCFLLPESGLHDDVEADDDYDRRNDTTILVPLHPAPASYRSIASEELPASLESLTVLGSLIGYENRLDLLCFLRLMVPIRDDAGSATTTLLLPRLRKVDIRGAVGQRVSDASGLASFARHADETKAIFNQFDVEFVR